MSIYHVWARFNLYSFEDELTIFDINEVPELEDEDVLVDSYDNKYFKCDLYDGYSETSYLVVIKINENSLEEIRLIQPLEWKLDEKINKKEKLNIEEGFIDEGYTELKITNSMKFSSKTGKFSFRSLYQGSMYSDDVRENCINSLKKNDLDINGILAGLRKSPRFIDKEDGGFSFSWKKGEYEAFNVNAVMPKTIYKADDVEVNFPCCSKTKKFNTDMFKSQWGVKKLYCEDCDKYHTNFEQYFTFQKEKIDFNQCGIDGYKDEEEEIIYGSVIRPQSNKNDKIDFIIND